MTSSLEHDGAPDPVVDGAEPPDAAADVPWQRLDARMIWVDVVRVLLSMTPAAVAVLVVGSRSPPGRSCPSR